MELLTANINKLYGKYFATAMGSTIIASIYASVDLIAIGQYSGPVGSAAVACINPLWTLMICFGILFGVGGSVLMSTHRGAGNTRSGDEYFTLSLALGIIFGAAILVVFQLWSGEMMTFFGADDEVLPYAMEYFRWIVYASPTFLLTTLLSNFIRNDGSPTICTVSVITGGVLNIIGDYVLVFVFDMGMSGAGLATAIGQFIGFFVLCTYFFRKSCTLRLVKVKNLFNKVRTIFVTGFSPFIVDLSFGIVVIMFNKQIVHHAGNTELAVYGTVSNLAIFFQSLFYGVGQALQPLASTNFGAGKYDRVRSTLRISMITSLAMSVLFFAVSMAIPLPLLKLFMAVDEAVTAVGPPAMQIYGVSFLFMGINVVSTYYLQSVLKSGQSVLISLLRGFIICAAAVMILPAVFGFEAIWWTMPVTELLTMLPAVIFLRKTSKA